MTPTKTKYRTTYYEGTEAKVQSIDAARLQTLWTGVVALAVVLTAVLHARNMRFSVNTLPPEAVPTHLIASNAPPF